MIKGKTLIVSLLVLGFISISACSGRSKSESTIELHKVNKVYDATPFVLDYNIEGDGDLSFDWYKGNKKISEAPKDAGEYVVSITISETKKYKELSKDFNITISKKELSLEWKMDDLEFNKKEHVPTVRAMNLIEGDQIDFDIELVGNNVFKTNEGFFYRVKSINNDNYELPKNPVSPTYHIEKDPFFTPIVFVESANEDYEEYSHDTSKHLLKGNDVIVYKLNRMSDAFNLVYLTILPIDGSESYIDGAISAVLYTSDFKKAINFEEYSSEGHASYFIELNEILPAGDYFIEFQYDVSSETEGVEVKAELFWRAKRSETTITWLKTNPITRNYTQGSKGIDLKEDEDYSIEGSTGERQIRIFDTKKADGEWDINRYKTNNDYIHPGEYGLALVVNGDMNYDEAMSEIITLVIDKAISSKVFNWTSNPITHYYSPQYGFNPQPYTHYTTNGGIYDFERQKLIDDNWVDVTSGEALDVGNYRIRAYSAGDDYFLPYYSDWKEYEIIPCVYSMAWNSKTAMTMVEYEELSWRLFKDFDLTWFRQNNLAIESIKLVGNNQTISEEGFHFDASILYSRLDEEHPDQCGEINLNYKIRNPISPTYRIIG